MEKINLKCNSCGSRKFIKSGSNFYECKYCGSILRINDSKEENNFAKVFEPVVTSKKDDEQKAETNTQIKKERDYSPLMPIIIKMLVCFFVGVFGIHKFMEGKVFLGLVYLFTFGLFGIGPVVDFFAYLIKLLNKFVEINEG